MTDIRHWAMPLLLAMGSACSAAPDEVEGAPVEPGSFDDIAERESATHFNHWAPSAAGGMDQYIGTGTSYANCANWSLWDMFASDARSYGHHEYRTKSATTTRSGGSVRPYSGTAWDACDGYGGANCSVVSRVQMLINNNSYWNTSDIWSRVVGWNGSVYANTMSRSHVAGECTGAFVLTFTADSSYSRGEYWFQSGHDFSSADMSKKLPITQQTACTSTHPDSVPWNAMDIYVRECNRDNANDCRNRLAASVKKNGGTWSYGSCDSGTPYVYYSPPSGYRPLYFNAVVSSGIGHVPAPAKIIVQRWWN
jgi:hypothetical protein